jgi:hypothetical protein
MVAVLLPHKTERVAGVLEDLEEGMTTFTFSAMAQKGVEVLASLGKAAMVSLLAVVVLAALMAAVAQGRRLTAVGLAALMVAAAVLHLQVQALLRWALGA